MNLRNSDKYEFVYPNYSLNKLFNLENKYFDIVDVPRVIKKILYKCL